MKKIILVTAILLCSWLGLAQAEDHRIGGGVSYWVAVDDIDVDDVDENGFSYIVSYQYWPSLLGVELDFEVLPDRFGDTAYAPQAFVLVGKTLYAGAGIGIISNDGDFADEPFFSLKAGLNLEMLPNIYLDIFGTYRFNDTADFDDENLDIDSDTIFLGSALRFAL